MCAYLLKFRRLFCKHDVSVEIRSSITTKIINVNQMSIFKKVNVVILTNDHNLPCIHTDYKTL